ncbi:hypothetical protein J7J12_01925 [bacterium]|nr:hypothetical protein [bacterium]
MTEKELISKIRLLKDIEPSQRWINFSFENLSKEIYAEPEDNFSVFSLFVKPALISIFTMLILIGGPWLLVKAAENSVPGEILYPFKKTVEKVQTVIYPDQKIAQLHLEFAKRRIQELSRITEQSASQKELNEVISELKNNLEGANQHLSKLPKKEVNNIVKKTKRIKQELNIVKNDLPKGESEDLNEAEKLAEEINQEILTVLSKEKKDQEATAATTTTTTTDEESLIWLNKETSTPSALDKEEKTWLKK